nr:hypothetical protein [Tanacetum cinerariifolium]
METHIALTQPTQVNKVTTLCEICSGPHDTQYCMEDPKQAFVVYASSRIDEAGGKCYTFKPEENNLGDTYNPSWRSHPNLSLILNRSFNNHPQRFNHQSNLEEIVSNFMASQDARLTKFEIDFKHQQSKITNKIDTVLKAITDRVAGALPSDTVKNPKTSLPQTGIGIKTQQPEEPKPTLEDEFQDLHLNLPVPKVLAHDLIYNAILDKYVESLELGPQTPLLVARRFLATANAVIDCRMSKIAVGKGITRSVFGIKGVNLGEKEAPYWTTLEKRESYKPRLSSDEDKPPKTEMEHGTPRLERSIQTERSLPKPYNQSPPLGSSPKEKVQ